MQHNLRRVMSIFTRVHIYGRVYTQMMPSLHAHPRDMLVGSFHTDSLHQLNGFPGRLQSRQKHKHITEDNGAVVRVLAFHLRLRV
jgi:hypothetical protein